MKRLMFMLIFLLVIPFCKAADPDESWNQAVANMPNWQQLENLDLRSKGITKIPVNLKLPNLMRLNLTGNDIKYVDLEILEGLPNLRLLVLNKNPLTQENINNLKEKAKDVGLRDRAGCLELSIIADELSIIADPDESWYQAVAGIPNWQQAENLDLRSKGITKIPVNLKLPNLMRLNLTGNDIKYVDLEILEGLPNLRLLVLNKNPLTPENITQLKKKAEDVDLRDEAGLLELSILADNIGPQHSAH